MHALRQQHAQQRLTEVDAALHAGQRRDEQPFERNEREHARVVGRSYRARFASIAATTASTMSLPR